jgi:Smg protein
MDKIVIAINMIIDYVEKQDEICERDLAEFLYSTGFDDYEVRQTLSVFNFNNNDILSVRYFTRTETSRLTSNAMLYLQKLHLSGLMDAITLESVVEKVQEFDAYKIDVNQIKQIALLVLIEKSAHLFRKDKDDEETLH